MAAQAQKIALITGGAGGLGKAFAESLLTAKATAVCLVDINKAGEGIAAELKKKFHPASVEFFNCDVTDYTAFEDVFKKVKDKFGKIDIVCNNAGMTSMDFQLERSIKALRLNLESVYYGTKLGQEYMDQHAGGRGGVIVNVASMAAFLPMQGSMVYTGTKAGVVGLSRAAAMEYDVNGVRVNALCPSFTDTPILDNLPGSREMIVQPLLTPEFVAQGFMELVSNETRNSAIMRVTPQKGIDYYDFNFRRSKQTSKL